MSLALNAIFFAFVLSREIFPQLQNMPPHLATRAAQSLDLPAGAEHKHNKVILQTSMGTFHRQTSSPEAARPPEKHNNNNNTNNNNNLPISGESQYHNHVAMLATQNSHSHSHKMPSPNGVSGGVCPYASQMSSSSPGRENIPDEMLNFSSSSTATASEEHRKRSYAELERQHFLANHPVFRKQNITSRQEMVEDYLQRALKRPSDLETFAKAKVYSHAFSG